jgi:hypothetical protein
MTLPRLQDLISMTVIPAQNNSYSIGYVTCAANIWCEAATATTSLLMLP